MQITVEQMQKTDLIDMLANLQKESLYLLQL